MRNGVAVSGGTGAHLPFVSLTSGTYTVDVSNGFASVVSERVDFREPKFTDLFALVTGGTLPASSELGAVPVDTFYIGKTEVTWGEWKFVRTWAVANGYTDLDGVGQGTGDNYPVSHVSWYDVVKWCNARSEKESRTPVYRNGTDVYRTGEVSDPAVVASANGYRLPSEKEWEFAARGGTQTLGYTYSGSNDLNAVGWYGQNSDGAVKEVGKKQANELGIYDMSGNLWEWSGSWYPGLEGSCRVIRGGDWNASAEGCTVAYRGYNIPGNHGGFRVASSGEYALAITTQPSISSAGTTIGVQAAGAGTLTYQWKRNGVEVAGGTSAQLPTQGLPSGAYTVVVSNGFATVTSASLTVNTPTVSANFIKWGTNSAEGRLSVPSNLSDVVTIDAGNNHSVALKTDGSVVAWGGNGGAENIAIFPAERG
jgi:formylglycine-generating enzyme required for sulfatase activity